jgi:hypothetical protein
LLFIGLLALCIDLRVAIGEALGLPPLHPSVDGGCGARDYGCASHAS